MKVLCSIRMLWSLWMRAKFALVPTHNVHMYMYHLWPPRNVAIVVGKWAHLHHVCVRVCTDTLTASKTHSHEHNRFAPFITSNHSGRNCELLLFPTLKQIRVWPSQHMQPSARNAEEVDNKAGEGGGLGWKRRARYNMFVYMLTVITRKRLHPARHVCMLDKLQSMAVTRRGRCCDCALSRL